MVEQARFDAQQFGLGLLAVGDEAAVEAVARTFDIGEQRSEHTTGAAFRCGDGQLLVAQPVHQSLGLRIQMVWKRGLKRLTHPRSPFLGAGTALPRSAAERSRTARNSLSGLQFGHSRELARSRPRL